MEMFLELAWRQGWISPAKVIEHCFWYVYYRGKRKDELTDKTVGVEVNGNGFQIKVPNNSG